MLDFYAAIILLLLAVAGVVVRKTYGYIPLLELKRRAEMNDPLAVKLYAAASYGRSLRGLLWLFIVLTSAAGVVLLSRSAPIWLSIIAVVLLLWATYSWLPQSRTTVVGVRLTTLVNPVILALLGRLHPMLERSTRLVEKRYTAEEHTGLYERDDLINLIEQQQHQADSRFTDDQLEIAKRALSFEDHTVSDILTPKKRVKSVLASDTIGPVLIDELHKSNQNHILVRESAKGDFIGTLNYKQLSIQSTGTVKSFINPSIYYIHEDDSLAEALKTFFATNRPLFIVVNNAEEYVGIVTIEDILKQLLGHVVPSEDLEQHMSASAVVARHKKTKDVREEEYEFIDEDEEPSSGEVPKSTKHIDEEITDIDETPVKTDDEVIK